MSPLRIGQICDVVWQMARDGREVMAYCDGNIIFMQRNGWRGPFPRPAEADRVVIRYHLRDNIYRCHRVNKAPQLGEVLTVRWRWTKSNKYLVAAFGNSLIFPKMNAVNWGNNLFEGNELRVTLIEQTAPDVFRCVPAADNLLFNFQDVRIDDCFLLSFSLGHRSSIALLADGTVIVPSVNEWKLEMPNPGEIWPVQVCRIDRYIYVKPLDFLVYAERNRICSVAEAWPERKVVRFIADGDCLLAEFDGNVHQVDLSEWTVLPQSGQIWAVTIVSDDLELGPKLVPFMQIGANYKNDKTRILRFACDGRRMLSRVSDEKIICFPCLQHWDQRYFKPREGEVYAVRVVGSKFDNVSRIEFVEPFILVPESCVPPGL